MYIVHSNHCNVIVDVFVCSVYFILSVEWFLVSSFLFISYVMSRGDLGDALWSTRVPRSTGWETLLYGIEKT